MAVHKDFNSAFKAMYRKISSVQSILPNVLANEGTKFFVSNFELEGFTNIGFDAWTPRKTKSKKGKKKILVQSGRLRRAVNKSVKEKTFKRIVWEVNKSEVPYASVHNNGGAIYRNSRKKTTIFNMPRRHFMGKSEFLNKRFKLRIKEAYAKAFNK